MMIGAVALVHAPVDFFMNWGGTAAGEGFEYHLLAIALALPLAIKGRSYSVHRVLARLLEGGRTLPSRAVVKAA